MPTCTGRTAAKHPESNYTRSTRKQHIAWPSNCFMHCFYLIKSRFLVSCCPCPTFGGQKNRQSESSFSSPPFWFHFFSHTDTNSDTHIFQSWCHCALSGPRIPPPVSFSPSQHDLKHPPSPHPPSKPQRHSSKSDGEPTGAGLMGDAHPREWSIDQFSLICPP